MWCVAVCVLCGVCMVSAADDNDGRLSTVVHHLQFRTVIPAQPHKNQSFTITNIVYVCAAAKCSMMVSLHGSPFALPQRTPNTCSTYMLWPNRIDYSSIQFRNTYTNINGNAENIIRFMHTLHSRTTHRCYIHKCHQPI